MCDATRMMQTSWLCCLPAIAFSLRHRYSALMLTLRQLRYLDALARHRHFGRAAEECAVSQPALSMQIHELEEFLGGELVERHQGEAILTGCGIQIAERAAL